MGAGELEMCRLRIDHHHFRAAGCLIKRWAAARFIVYWRQQAGPAPAPAQTPTPHQTPPKTAPCHKSSFSTVDLQAEEQDRDGADCQIKCK